MSDDNDHSEETLIPVAASELRSARAIEFLEYICSGWYPFVNFLNCYHSKESFFDVIKIAVDVEVSQLRANDIREKEILYIAFTTHDHLEPYAIPGRNDFPHIMHLNRYPYDMAGIAPISLCLSVHSFEDRKAKWTSYTFIESIRSWLSSAASGKLHLEDQPLEPFFFPSEITLVVSDAAIDELAKNPHADIDFFPNYFKENQGVLLTKRDTDPSVTINPINDYVGLVVETPPFVHGVIKRIPTKLSDLIVNLNDLGIDFLETLRQFTKSGPAKNGGKYLLLILKIPLKKTADGEVFTHTKHAFISTSTIADIGLDIGTYGRVGSAVARLISTSSDTNKKGENIAIAGINIVEPLTRNNALKFNDLTDQELGTLKIAAVGLGAIGSQVCDKLIRSGIGSEWHFIDKDVLLPHNLVRHQLPAHYLGFPKAVAMTQHLQYHNPDQTKLLAHHINIQEAEHDGALKDALKTCDIILDFAASEGVLKYLAHFTSGARRMAGYVIPNQHAAVILTEDKERLNKLDYLDMCIYRECMHNEKLQEIIARSIPAKAFRYGGTCSDITTAISNSLLSLYTAGISELLKKNLIAEESSALFWALDQEMNAYKVVIPLSQELRTQADGWEIITDNWLMEKIREARKDRLPNETGGVLIGTYDLNRKKIYIADFIPSPTDSVEMPTGYIRGCNELTPMVATYRKKSFENFDYIGEWHSHPPGHSSQPSATDEEAISIIKQEYMAPSCLPAIMLIVGEEDHTWLVR